VTPAFAYIAAGFGLFVQTVNRQPSARFRAGLSGFLIIKGKSAIHLARVFGERKRNFVGQHFWARGYFVSTVGRDEVVIRECIRKQEEEDSRLYQMNLWR
jgi:REP element-mobilizing transposase RayT